jgi:hypothetical protein
MLPIDQLTFLQRIYIGISMWDFGIKTNTIEVCMKEDCSMKDLEAVERFLQIIIEMKLMEMDTDTILTSSEDYVEKPLN